jgi:hypothetical protein
MSSEGTQDKLPQDEGAVDGAAKRYSPNPPPMRKSGLQCCEGCGRDTYRVLCVRCSEHSLRRPWERMTAKYEAEPELQ